MGWKVISYECTKAKKHNHLSLFSFFLSTLSLSSFIPPLFSPFPSLFISLSDLYLFTFSFFHLSLISLSLLPSLSSLFLSLPSISVFYSFLSSPTCSFLTMKPNNMLKPTKRNWKREKKCWIFWRGSSNIRKLSSSAFFRHWTRPSVCVCVC